MSIVLPVGITFDAWAATLFVDFSTDEIPLPPTEADWKDWAARLVERNVFQNDDIPRPYGFNDWREWAQRVAQVING
jgi:hypothetical protein